MFLRRSRRTHNGATYEYWSLLRTVRTSKGPRHELVAHLGKVPGLGRHDEGLHVDQPDLGWEHIEALLEGRAPAPIQGELGKPLPVPARQWTQVDVRGLRVERVRAFGQVYLALALWRRLGLHQLLGELIAPGREAVPWEQVACILTLARFCGNQSELEVAECWYADTALEDLLGVPLAQVNDSRLYRGLDMPRRHKDRLCQHLLGSYQSWFGVRFEFLPQHRTKPKHPHQA